MWQKFRCSGPTHTHQNKWHKDIKCLMHYETACYHSFQIYVSAFCASKEFKV